MDNNPDNNKIYNLFLPALYNQDIVSLNELCSDPAIKAIFPLNGFKISSQKKSNRNKDYKRAVFLCDRESNFPYQLLPKKTSFTIVTSIDFKTTSNVSEKFDVLKKELTSRGKETTEIEENANLYGNEKKQVLLGPGMDTCGFDKCEFNKGCLNKNDTKSRIPTLGSSKKNNIYLITNKDDNYTIVSVISSPRSSIQFKNVMTELSKVYKADEILDSNYIKKHLENCIRNSRRLLAYICSYLCLNVQLEYDLKAFIEEEDLNTKPLMISRKSISSEFYIDSVEELDGIKNLDCYMQYMNRNVYLNSLKHSEYDDYVNMKLFRENPVLKRIGLGDEQLVDYHQYEELNYNNGDCKLYGIFLDSSKNPFYTNKFTNYKPLIDLEMHVYNKSEMITKESEQEIYKLMKKNVGNKFKYHVLNDFIYYQKKFLLCSNNGIIKKYINIFTKKKVDVYPNNEIVSSNCPFFAFPLYFDNKLGNKTNELPPSDLSRKVNKFMKKIDKKKKVKQVYIPIHGDLIVLKNMGILEKNKSRLKMYLIDKQLI